MYAIRLLVFLAIYISGPAYATKLYVTNNYSGTVSAINIDTNTVVSTINVGGQPYGIAVNPVGTRIYVTDGFGNSRLSVIDTTTDTVIATVPLNNPLGVAVHPVNGDIYVANYGNAKVSVIDPITFAIKTTISVVGNPFMMTMNGNGSKLYLTDYATNRLTIITTATKAKTYKTVASEGNVGLAFNKGTDTAISNRVFVANYIASTISAVNSGNTVSHWMNTPAYTAYGIAIKNNGLEAYVTSYGGNLLYHINLKTKSLITLYGTHALPTGVALSPKEKRLYVANFSPSTISVFDTADHSIITNISVGSGPMFMAIANPQMCQ